MWSAISSSSISRYLEHFLIFNTFFAVDVIELSSESEDEEDDDDCVMMPSTTEEEEDEPEAEDVNNGGSHINDDFNCADEKGRVLVNVGHPAEDPDIYLTPQVARAIKPHQVRKLYYLGAVSQTLHSGSFIII